MPQVEFLPVLAGAVDDADPRHEVDDLLGRRVVQVVAALVAPVTVDPLQPQVAAGRAAVSHGPAGHAPAPPRARLASAVPALIPGGRHGGPPPPLVRSRRLTEGAAAARARPAACRRLTWLQRGTRPRGAARAGPPPPRPGLAVRLRGDSAARRQRGEGREGAEPEEMAA